MHSADFYDPDNEEGLVARHTACDAALADLIAYMRQDGVRVAAFDATNTTRDRRAHVVQKLMEAGLGVKRMFVESICNDETVSALLLYIRGVWGDQQLLVLLMVVPTVYDCQILEENIRKVKLSTPDYRGMGHEKAIDDFKQRRGTLAIWEKAY